MSTNTARISALETAVANLAEGQNRILALLEAGQPAKVTRPKAAAKRKPARKAAPKAQPKADLALCKATRVRFVEAAAREGVDFAGMSTKAIAAMCVEDPSLVPAGFRIGDGYAALYA